MRKALAWIGGILAAVFIGAFLVDQRHTYEARRQQIKKRRTELDSKAQIIDGRLGAILRATDDKKNKVKALEAERGVIRDRAAKLRKSEVSYEQALARLGHDPADWDRLGLGV